MLSKKVFFAFVCAAFLCTHVAHAVDGASNTVTVPTDGKGKQALGADFMPWCEQMMARYRNPGAGCHLACRTKNSGAQRYNAVASQFGAIGADSNNNTARFASYAQGLGAHTALLRTYCSKYGKCTLHAVTAKWAPAGHANNNPVAYANQVGKWIGLDPRLVFDPNDINQMAKIVVGMSRFELGDFKYTCAEAAQGVNMAFGNTPMVAGPSNIGTLIEGSPAGAQLYQSLFNQSQGFGDPFNMNGTNPFGGVSTGGSAPTNSGGQTGGMRQAPGMQQPFMQQPYNPSLNATAQTQDLGFVPGASYGSDSDTDVQVSDTGIAEISCKKNSVAWVCNDTTSSRGVSKPVDTLFTTKNARIGSLYVNPKVSTLYTIQCIKNQKIVDSASCTLEPYKRTPDTKPSSTAQLSLEVDKTPIRLGERATLTWTALRASFCSLEGEGIQTEGLEGSIETEPILQDGRWYYTLTCEGSMGQKIEKRTYVDVE